MRGHGAGREACCGEGMAGQLLTLFWALQRWKVCLMASMVGKNGSIESVEAQASHGERAQRRGGCGGWRKPVRFEGSLCRGRRPSSNTCCGVWRRRGAGFDSNQTGPHIFWFGGLDPAIPEGPIPAGQPAAALNPGLEQCTPHKPGRSSLPQSARGCERGLVRPKSPKIGNPD